MIRSQPQEVYEAIYVSRMNGDDWVLVHNRPLRLPDTNMTILAQVNLERIIVVGDVDRTVGSVEGIGVHKRPND